jgi:hypothetical protein
MYRRQPCSCLDAPPPRGAKKFTRWATYICEDADPLITDQGNCSSERCGRGTMELLTIRSVAS